MYYVRHFIWLCLVLTVAGSRSQSVYQGDLSEELIRELYKKYKEAVANDADRVILRRLFDHNRLFEIHIEKLREVNGLKQHNLLVKNLRTGEKPLIYINNPVESKIPNAFLTLSEFKDSLTKRIEHQRIKTTPKEYILFFNKTTFVNKITPKKMKSKKKGSTSERLTTKKKTVDQLKVMLVNRPEVGHNNITVKATEEVMELFQASTESYQEPVIFYEGNGTKLNVNSENVTNEINTDANFTSTSDNTKKSILQEAVKHLFLNITDVNTTADRIIEIDNGNSTQSVTGFSRATFMKDNKISGSEDQKKEFLKREVKDLKVSSRRKPKRKSIVTTVEDLLTSTGKIITRTPFNITHSTKSNATTTNEVKKISKKRSTLGRPLVYMGGL